MKLLIQLSSKAKQTISKYTLSVLLCLYNNTTLHSALQTLFMRRYRLSKTRRNSAYLSITGTVIFLAVITISALDSGNIKLHVLEWCVIGWLALTSLIVLSERKFSTASSSLNNDEKDQLAKDLHDELGSSLNTIKIYATLAMQNNES